MLSFLKNFLLPPLPEWAKPVTADEGLRLIAENKNLFILDVRTEKEFAEKHYQKAVLIPVSELQNRIHEVPKEKDVLIYCHSGNRARMALRFFEGRKGTVYFIDGFPKFN